jgi:hypothetical protein
VGILLVRFDISGRRQHDKWIPAIHPPCEISYSESE